MIYGVFIVISCIVFPSYMKYFNKATKITINLPPLFTTPWRNAFLTSAKCINDAINLNSEYSTTRYTRNPYYFSVHFDVLKLHLFRESSLCIDLRCRFESLVNIVPCLDKNFSRSRIRFYRCSIALFVYRFVQRIAKVQNQHCIVCG